MYRYICTITIRMYVKNKSQILVSIDVKLNKEHVYINLYKRCTDKSDRKISRQPCYIILYSVCLYISTRRYRFRDCYNTWAKVHCTEVQGDFVFDLCAFSAIEWFFFLFSFQLTNKVICSGGQPAWWLRVRRGPRELGGRGVRASGPRTYSSPIQR